MPFSRCQRRSETSAIPPVLTLGHWRGRGKQSTAVSKLFPVESGRRDETTPFIWVNGVASTAGRSSSLRSSSAARLSAAELTASAVVAPIFTASKLPSIPSTAKSAGTAPKMALPQSRLLEAVPRENLASADRTRQQQHPPSAAIAPTSATAASAELAAFFLVFYLEFHAEHVVVLSEPWLPRPECANGVQVQ